MGALNFKNLTRKNNFALVNYAITEEEEEEECFFDYDFEEVKTTIEEQNFNYYNLELNFGYYNGFYIVINDDNTKYIYDNEKEKKEVLKELTQIKKILINFVKNGLLFGVYNFWYYDKLPEQQTIKNIKEQIKELKEETKKAYTTRKAKQQKKCLWDIVKEYN